MKTNQLNLARALVYKKRVLQQINKVTGLIASANSYVENELPAVDVRAAIQKRQILVDHLVTLKLRMSKATEKIQPLIFKISELKSLITVYQSLTTTSGVVRNHYDPNTTCRYVAEITAQEKDQRIAQLELEIDETQSEIDQFNSQMMIEIPELITPNEYREVKIAV